MAETQFEADEFLKLLTEALRAGPGSPAWHDAITRLNAGGLSESEEYRLLLTVREDLESGRDWRSIRPGPGFTQKVMRRLDDESGGQRRGVPLATLIAAISGLVIVATVVIVVVILTRSPKSNDPGGPSGYGIPSVFSSRLVTGDFSRPLSSDWQQFGLGVTQSSQEKGLLAVFEPGSREYKTGGIYHSTSLPANKTFSVEATLRMLKPTSQAYVQVFIADNPKSDSPRQFLVWLNNGDLACYDPEGKLAGSAVPAPVGTVNLSIRWNAQYVIVESGGKQLYAGPHGLDEKPPRFAGLRFGAQGKNGIESVVVQSMTILEP